MERGTTKLRAEQQVAAGAPSRVQSRNVRGETCAAVSSLANFKTATSASAALQDMSHEMFLSYCLGLF